MTTRKPADIFNEIRQKVSDLDYATLSFHNSLLLDEVQELLRELEPLAGTGNSVSAPTEIPYAAPVPITRNKKIEPEQRFKVMVVDDDDDIIRLLKFTLKGIGVEVVPYKDPLLALAEIKSVNPQLVLLDILMPQMSGFEFLDQINARGLAGNFKLIVASGKHSRTDRILALEKGAIDYLEKPYDIQELRLRIEKLKSELVDNAA